MAKDESEKSGRRGALKALVVLGGAAFAGVVAVPGVELLVAPVGKDPSGALWVKTIRFDSLTEGEAKRVSIVSDRRDAWTLEKAVELGAVWLIRNGAAIDCFSVVCPHLGCSVAAVPAGAAGPHFNCLCHDSDFAIDGTRQSGPAPRDLDSLATKVEDGYVLVDFRTYRQGTPDKTEIG